MLTSVYEGGGDIPTHFISALIYFTNENSLFVIWSSIRVSFPLQSSLSVSKCFTSDLNQCSVD